MSQLFEQPGGAAIETYLPLYRKYRPQSFADLVGQEAIAKTLGHAIEMNKVAHAYLFCGPRGTGKTSAARILAKSLNCAQGPTVTPCQACPSCTGISQGKALDVVEFDAASNNSVDDARELIENCQFAPMAGKFKIYIIDEVHMLSAQAFNALLKTLEEPPPNVVFIFATTEAHKVLPTIISRCQRFDFNRITTADIIQRLAWVAGEENIRIDAEALATIARHARGGLRDAVGLLDQVAVLGRAEPDTVIGRKDVALFIGFLEEELLLGLSQAIAEKNAQALLTAIGDLVGRGVEPAQLVKELTQHFRNLLLVKVSGKTGTAETFGLSGEYFEQLQAQSELFASEVLPQILTRLSSIDWSLRNTQQPQLWLEVGLIEIAYREEIHAVKELAERVKALEETLVQGGPALVGRKAPMPPSSAASVPAASAAPAPATPFSGAAAAPTIKAPERPAASSVSVPPVHSPSPAAAQPVSPASAPPAPKVANVTNTNVAASAPGSVTRPEQKASAAAVGGTPAGKSAESSWDHVTALVASPNAKSLVQQHTFLLSVDETKVVVGCSSEQTLSILKKPDKLIHLQKAVEKFFGHPLQVELTLADRSAAAVLASMPVMPEKPRVSPASPAVSSAPEASPPVASPVSSQISDAPPLSEDMPPLSSEETDDVPVSSSSPSPESSTWAPSQDASVPAAPVTGASGDLFEPDIQEARQYTVNLLQGRLMN